MNVKAAYLLTRTIEISHRCQPSIVNRIGENGPILLLVVKIPQLLL